MNGRAYDYNLGRFLSVDPFVQSPGNSQSMNPYSYIMNNPLAGTDPSGYAAECEDALGKGCGEDEPKKERRDPRSGKGFGWQTAWKSSSGKDHYGTVEDSNGKRHNAVIRTNVEVKTEDIGSTPIKDIESITIAGDNETTHITVSPTSGGTDILVEGGKGGKTSGTTVSWYPQKGDRRQANKPVLDFVDATEEAFTQVHKDLLDRYLESSDDPDFRQDLTEALTAMENIRMQYQNRRGPGGAEAVFGSNNTIIFYKGAVYAYLDGSKADKSLGYLVDLKAGMHAAKGLLLHEIGHSVRRNVYDSNGNKLPDKEIETKADKWVRRIYPGEY